MNAGVRRTYFTQVWPPAAAALGVRRSDDETRRAVQREAMRLVRGPETDSFTELGPDEITALFTYCRWLADRDNLRALSAWTDCQDDYRAYNRALQGDHYRRRAGYAKGGRLERDRFAGAPRAGLYEESRMDREEAEQYLMTMRSRARAKEHSARYPGKTQPPRPPAPPRAKPSPAPLTPPRRRTREGAAVAAENCPF